MQVRYFYAWIPAISFGLFLVFVIPFLGPIALLVFVVTAVAALGKLSRKIVAALHAFGFPLRSPREPGGTVQREGASAMTLERQRR